MIKLTAKQKKLLKSFENFDDYQIRTLKDNPALISEYLKAAFESYAQDKNRVLLKESLGVVVRALGTSRVAKETGNERAGLYRAFSAKGNPRFDTLFNVLDVAGVCLVPREKCK